MQMGWNRMITDSLVWRKSSRSGASGGGNCIEVGTPADASVVAVRDTKDRQGGTLAVSPEAFRAFVATVK